MTPCNWKQMGKKSGKERKRKEKVDGAVSLLNLKIVSQFCAVMALFSQIVTRKWLHQLQTVFFFCQIFKSKMFNYFLPVFSLRVIDNLPVATTFELEGKVHVNWKYFFVEQKLFLFISFYYFITAYGHCLELVHLSAWAVKLTERLRVTFIKGRWLTWSCTMWPSFLITSHLLLITSTKK